MSNLLPYVSPNTVAAVRMLETDLDKSVAFVQPLDDYSPMLFRRKY